MADPEGKAEEVVDMGGEEATSEEPSSQGDDAQQPSEIASKLMQDPMVLAALQQKLGSIVGGSSGYVQSLPKPVKRRIKALKKLQFEATKIEAEFYREVHRLECEYANKYAPLFEKRATMVTGAYEPNDDEADWPSDDEKDDLAVSGPDGDEVKKASIEDKKEENAEKEDGKDEDAKGIPGFWLTIFKNVDMLSEMIQSHDEPILNHLQEVKVEFKEKDPMGFTLEFMFEPNEYFENKKLTKEYTMRSEPDEADPFSFEGPEIVKCQGCKIDWKKGKNVTVKTVKKKQKHKASGTTRTISKTVQSDSFFNFFTPPTPPDDEEMDEDTEALLAADFEIGHFIRERIVPRAVLYFTGEALENDDDDYEDGEEEGGEEGEYDEDGDPDYNPGGLKYLTPAFQARAAQLALGQVVSMPAQAPTDTRLSSRPSTAASMRHPSAHVDLPSRPDTAPVGTEGFHTPQPGASAKKIQTKSFQGDNKKNKEEPKSAGTKPNVQERDSQKTNNSAKSMNLSRSVSFHGKTVAVDHTGKPITTDEQQIKRLRQPQALTNAMEPEKSDQVGVCHGLTRETTFYDQRHGQIQREKAFVSGKPVGSKVEKPASAQLQPVVEVSTSELEESADEPIQHKNSKGKLVVPQLDMKESSKQSTHTKSKQVGQLKNEFAKQTKGDNAKQTKGDSVKPTIEIPNTGTTDGTITIERDTTFVKSTGKSNKTEARSILQRLTGKNGGHRAGQVPNINKPVRKYTFAKPQELLVQEESGRQTASAPVGHGRSQSVPASRRGRQERREGYKPPSATLKPASVTDSRQVGIKPASAPAHKRYPQDRPEVKTGLQHRNPNTANRPNKGYPNPKASIQQMDQRVEGDDLGSADSGQQRGVRMQNAMINSSLEASGHAVDETEEDAYEDDDLGGLHPKLRGSPYLRNNPLVMPKKKRRANPGASRATMGKEGPDPLKCKWFCYYQSGKYKGTLSHINHNHTQVCYSTKCQMNPLVFKCLILVSSSFHP